MIKEIQAKRICVSDNFEEFEYYPINLENDTKGINNRITIPKSTTMKNIFSYSNIQKIKKYSEIVEEDESNPIMSTCPDEKKVELNVNVRAIMIEPPENEHSESSIDEEYHEILEEV
jgi:hypothetical protein